MAQQKIHHRTHEDKGTVKNLKSNDIASVDIVLNPEKFSCHQCNRGAYFFVEVCNFCRSLLCATGTNHLEESASDKCIQKEHFPVLLRHFKVEVMGERIAQLRNILSSADVPYPIRWVKLKRTDGDGFDEDQDVPTLKPTASRNSRRRHKKSKDHSKV